MRGAVIARATAFALALAGALAAAPSLAQNASGTPGLNRHLGDESGTSGSTNAGKSESGVSPSESGIGTSESGVAATGKSKGELPKSLAEKLNHGKVKHRTKASHVTKPSGSAGTSPPPPDVSKFMNSEEAAPASH